LQFCELQYLLFTDYDLQSAVNHHISHCYIVLQRIDWLMILTEVNKVALQCKNKLPFPDL